MEDFTNSGVHLDADISAPIIESVFFKDSPLHDGAMIITDNKILIFKNKKTIQK